MKKRILCVLLTLIMLISLVPATAISAAAATNAVGEDAILVLKQLEGYQMTCEDGYIGYGAKCPDCLGKTGVNAAVDGCNNVMYEKEADSILRKELKELDKAVNTFASNNGLNLTKSQHDALVLFSFQNGTAWTIGTGALQTAIKSGYTGSKFVDAICKWNYDINDDGRRMVEANMYLNGVYSSKIPSRYMGVEFVVEDGTMEEDKYQYFDVASPCAITFTPKPTNKDDIFLGWYTADENGERVSALNSTHSAKYHAGRPDLLKLYAHWQDKDADPTDESTNEILYTISKSALVSTTVYLEPNGAKTTTYINEFDKEVKIVLGNELNVAKDYVDENGVFWAKIVASVKDEDVKNPTIGWVKVKSGAVTGSGSDKTMDVTVTVTNSYVNMRSSASAASTKKGSFNYGDKLRIINVKNASNGALWGQVAASADDATPIGWVALMYTNYDEVIAANNSGVSVNNGTVVATATITYSGYVNVRSDAGINNQIVGALSQGVTVDLYEIKYVNGIQWGRCSTGWFCLNYANVTKLVDDNIGTSGAGFSNYVFSAVLNDYVEGEENFADSFFVTSPYGDGEAVVPEKDSNGDLIPMTSGKIVLSNLLDVNGTDWGKTSYGWIELSDVELDVAKFYVIADTLTVRENPDVASKRIDVLVRGTEFDVTEIDVVGENVWGKANKVGEKADPTYGGWVNLSNENVSRNGAPEISVGGSANGSGNTAATTVTMAKVVGTDSLNVRMTGATYGKKIGTLSYGTTAAVLGEKNGWYKLDIDVDNDPTTDSWVSGAYLEIYEGTPNSNTGSTGTGSNGSASVTGTGIVANTYTGVNIRTGPSTAYASVGKYITGTTVEILEVTTTGASKWGRTEKGWVCMDYIVMMENFNPGGSGTGTGSTTTTTSYAIYTGKLTESTTIYRDTSTKKGSEPIGEIVSKDLPVGHPVTVHEIIVQVEYIEEDDPDESNEGATTTIEKRTTYWARVNDGYIFAPGSCIELDPLDEHVYTLANKVEDIYNQGEIGDDYFDLAKGEQVVVTSLKIENSDVIGYIECDKGEGWVKMSNMTKGFASSVTPEPEEEEDTNTSGGDTGATEPTGPVIGSTGNTTNGYADANGYKYTGKVINTNEVNVRATASTGANITTKLKNGASLVIYETVISDGMAWGRCDAGWVYLYYVDLTPVANGAVDARVVYNDNTVIYSDMGMTQATGSTYAKMAVIDIYEIVGKMARTELGWVHTDNLL